MRIVISFRVCAHMRLRSVVSDGGASDMHGTVEVLFRASTFPLSRDIVSTFLLSELVL